MPEYRNIPIDAACYSTVARLGERTLCVTVPEMVKCGVSETYLWKVLCGHREGSYSCWPHHKEGKTVYLHYQGLKSTYQATIQSVLMDGLTPDAWYDRNGRIKHITERLEPYLFLSAKDEVYFDTAKYPNGAKLSLEEQEKGREACRWLSFFVRFRKKTDIKQLGYATSKELYDDVVFLINNKGIQLPTAYCKLREKIRDYMTNGAACCLDLRGQGNKNAAKVYDEEQTAVLRTICGKGASYNSQQVADFYNVIAEARGWDKISRRTALNYMNEYYLIIKAGRDGSEAFRNKLSMQNRRKRPTRALSFWTLDGWTVELYYQKEVKDSKGKVVRTYQNRLTAVVVLDASCNYPVGYAIGENESVSLIRAAVKNAIDYCQDTLGDRYRPYQIQSDHFGIKSMGTIYGDVAEYFIPARVKNAKSKPIERYFLHLNREYCQKHFGNFNWSGFGITSKRSSQPNIDVLNHNKTHFPDKEGVIKQVNWIIQEERKKKHSTWMQAWNAMPVEDRLLMDRETYLLRFGYRNERTKRLEAGCLEPTILGTKRAYDTFDLDFRKNPLQSWTVIYDERDLSSILVVDDTEKQRFLLNSVYEQPMALYDRKEDDFEALRKVDEFNKQKLEAYVVETVSEDEAIIGNMRIQPRELEGRNAVTMLADSRGQQKAWLQHTPLIKSEEDLAAEMAEKLSLKAAQTVVKQQKKEEKKERVQFEKARAAYLESEVDFNEYL